MISTQMAIIIAPGCLSKLIGGIFMEELFTSFMWTKVRRENVPAENMQSFLTFENKMLDLCSTYNTDRAKVIPAVSNDSGAIALVVGKLDGKYTIAFMVDRCLPSKRYVESCAEHEFMHIFFKKRVDIKEYLIDTLVEFVANFVVEGNDLDKKLKHKLFYAHLSIHRYKTNYKGKKNLWAEEAICEFATHLNSPVKDELFYAIVNDDVEDVELMFQICSTIIHL